MYGRGTRRVTAAAGTVALGLTLVACGNQTDGGTPSAGSSTSSTPVAAGTPNATPTLEATVSSPSPVRSVPQLPKPPTPVPAAPLTTALLLTGSDVAKADPRRGWITTSADSQPICGPASTRGNAVKGSLTRHFSTELDASGGQFLTRYDSPAAAKAAYERIVATVKSCKALDPAPTHARKLTENRTLPLGDATTILRWYDYPLPNDPGSEPGGFPYAITRTGTVISVLAFREMGQGVTPAHFESLTRTAAARLH